MKRIVVSIIALIASSAGTTANEANQKLLGLSEPERRQALADIIKRSGEDCDVVVRTILRHNVAAEPAFWNVGCRNKKSYWVIIAPNSDDRGLVLECEASKKFDKDLAEMARRADQRLASKPRECWK